VRNRAQVPHDYLEVDVAPIIGRLFLSKGAFFVYGTLVGPIANRAYQPVGSVARGAAKSVIKTGLAMGGALQKAVVSAKQGIDDIAAEAKSELSHKEADLTVSESDAAATHQGLPA
jgi:hypothetical protein